MSCGGMDIALHQGYSSNTYSPHYQVGRSNSSTGSESVSFRSVKCLYKAFCRCCNQKNRYEDAIVFSCYSCTGYCLSPGGWPLMSLCMFECVSVCMPYRQLYSRVLWQMLKCNNVKKVSVCGKGRADITLQVSRGTADGLHIKLWHVRLSVAHSWIDLRAVTFVSPN